MFSSPSFEYYDPTESWIEFRTINEIAELNFEFENWLIENGYYFVEAAGNSTQAHQQWKNNTVNKLKSTLTRFIQFSLQQIQKDRRLLQTNKAICVNTRRFPAKQNLSMKNAPNYSAAINRLSSPVTKGLMGLDLNTIDTNNKNVKANERIKKMILPAYTGQGDFKQFAKNYFYGAEGHNRTDLNYQQCEQILPLAYQFCLTYESKIHSLETEIGLILKFIGADTSADTNNMQPQSNNNINNQQMQQKNSPMNQMASSNPQANAVGMGKPVNADTNYEYFMKYYFDDLEPIQEALPTTQQKVISGQKSANPVDTVSKNSASSGAQSNNPSIMYKRKQAAVDIVIDAFNGKISAMGMIYHDFIYLLRAHIASYKGAALANEGRMQSQQPQIQQPQQQNPQKQMQQPMKQ